MISNNIVLFAGENGLRNHLRWREAIEPGCEGNAHIDSAHLAGIGAVDMGMKIMRLEIYSEHFLQCCKRKELRKIIMYYVKLFHSNTSLFYIFSFFYNWKLNLLW